MGVVGRAGWQNRLQPRIAPTSARANTAGANLKPNARRAVPGRPLAMEFTVTIRCSSI
jgi:hypothetical protein